YLSSYYNGNKGLRAKVDEQQENIEPQKAKHLDLPLQGLDDIEVLVGRFGPYIKKEADGEEITTSIPVSWKPSDITVEKLEELIKAEAEGPKSIGDHPKS